MLRLDGKTPETGDGIDTLFLQWDKVFEPLPEGTRLYIGMRRWWTEGQRESLTKDLSLWEAVQNKQEGK